MGAREEGGKAPAMAGLGLTLVGLINARYVRARP
jgi:putative effector of murein hydrolase